MNTKDDHRANPFQDLLIPKSEPMPGLRRVPTRRSLLNIRRAILTKIVERIRCAKSL
jgi:hypothetical protein